MTREALAAQQRRLDAAEQDLTVREAAAVQSGSPAQVLAELAAERDGLAQARDDLAARADLLADHRDPRGLPRQVPLAAGERDQAQSVRLRAVVERDAAAHLRHQAGADREHAVGLAQAAAVQARSGSGELADLRAALSSREVVGRAQGVLMSRHQVSSDQALALLVTAGEQLGATIEDVARHVDVHGELPERRRPASS